MKKMFNLKSLSLAVISVMSFGAIAQDSGEQEIVEKIKSQNEQFAQADVKVERDLSQYGLEGFYEVSIGGQNLIATPSARYVFLGDLFDLRDMRNLSEEVRNAKRSEVASSVIESMEPSNFITFTLDEGVEKIGSMYVFTDPTCPYCQRVHEEISDYKSAGVEVNYIPYPRSGIDGGRDYETLKKIVCADDPEQAMTDFKNGTAGNKYSSVGGDQKCHDIVAAGYQAGQEVGVTGTPFIYLSNGQTIPGYNPSQAVIARFEQ